MFDVLGYGITEEDLHSKNPDGSYKLLTLDIDFGLKCSLSCPHCFRKSENFKSDNNPVSFSELKNIIFEGKGLGLKYVKIIGAGEPFENSELVPLIQYLNSLEIVTAIFTKGHVLGNDTLVKKYYGRYGFNHSDALFSFLKESNVSLLLGFNSFNSDLQGDFIGAKESNKNSEYVNTRNQVIKLAIDYDFNEIIDGKTRFALICAPIKPENFSEVLDIYKFGRERNIYVLNCPTALSGLGKIEYLRTSQLMDIDIYIEKLKKLYIEIYSWGIEHNHISIEDVEKYGISLYAGGHPCNQVAAGMYITRGGKVIRCPGRDDDSFIVDNDVRSKPLKEIWMNSKNYQLAKQEDTFNFQCIARDGHLIKSPVKFYSNIKKTIIKKFIPVMVDEI